MGSAPGGADLAVEFVGGVGRMGHHHALVDLGPDAFALDVGARFAEPHDVGVERWMAAPEALLARRARGTLRGILLTHGHLDHIGALAPSLALLPGVPVYGTAWTLALARRQLEQAHGLQVDLRVVGQGEPLVLGATEVTWHAVTHSLPQASSVELRSPAGAVMHSGDFRIQPAPLVGAPTDLAGLQRAGDRGIDLALVDSTNAGRPGRTRSERDIHEALVVHLSEAPARVVFTTFASHVERLESILEAARLTGRRVAFYGRSLRRTVIEAREHGLLPSADPRVGLLEVLMAGPRDKCVVVASGTQGEARAAVARIARCEDPIVRLEPGDRVTWSARVIPGNERPVGRAVDGLLRQGVDCFPPWAPEAEALHGSGHARGDEVREWLELVRPRRVVPIHGEETHLAAHRRALVGWGFGAGRVLQPRSGEILVREGGDWSIRPGIPGRARAQVGTLWWPSDEPALRARRRAVEGGVAVVMVQAGPSLRASVATVGVFADDCRAEREAALARLVEQGEPVRLAERGERGRLAERRERAQLSEHGDRAPSEGHGDPARSGPGWEAEPRIVPADAERVRVAVLRGIRAQTGGRPQVEVRVWPEGRQHQG